MKEKFKKINIRQNAHSLHSSVFNRKELENKLRNTDRVQLKK